MPEKVDPQLCLDWIRGLHRGRLPAVGAAFCVECGNAHPCETYRSADGFPNWPAGLHTFKIPPIIEGE